MTRQGLGALVQGVAAVAAMHDVSIDVQGNGYWAQLRVLSCCLKKLKKKLRAIGCERDSVFFGTRVKSLLNGLHSYHSILVILKALLHTTLVFRRNDIAHQEKKSLRDATGAAAGGGAGLTPEEVRREGEGAGWAGEGGRGGVEGVGGDHVRAKPGGEAGDGGREAGRERELSALSQRAALARQLGRSGGGRGGGAASSGLAAGAEVAARLEFAPGDQVSELGLAADEVQLDVRRSLFLDSVTMEEVEDRVRLLDLSVLYGEVKGAFVCDLVALTVRAN